jgi:hypothetical protein
MRRGVLSVVLLMSACESPDDGEGETIAATESAGDGDGDGDAVCFSVQDPAPGVVPDCELPQPCPDVDFVLGAGCESGEPIYDPVPAACVVDELAAGTQADHRITDCDGGIFSESWRLQVLGDGTVIYSHGRYQDLVSERSASWRAMPDAAYFNACVTDTAQQFLDCIEGILNQECQLGEPTCPE